MADNCRQVMQLTTTKKRLQISALQRAVATAQRMPANMLTLRACQRFARTDENIHGS